MRIWLELAYCFLVFTPLVLPYIVVGFLIREAVVGFRIGWALSERASEWFTERGSR